MSNIKINKDFSTHKLPYQVAVIDATDAYYYADIMGRMERFDTFENLNYAKAVADALFIVNNYKWDSLDQMNDCDGGFDVRIYDQKMSLIYAAHQKFEENWIGEM